MNTPSDVASFALSNPFELSACVGLGVALVLAKVCGLVRVGVAKG